MQTLALSLVVSLISGQSLYCDVFRLHQNIHMGQEVGDDGEEERAAGRPGQAANDCVS